MKRAGKDQSTTETYESLVRYLNTLQIRSMFTLNYCIVTVGIMPIFPCSLLSLLNALNCSVFYKFSSLRPLSQYCSRIPPPPYQLSCKGLFGELGKELGSYKIMRLSWYNKLLTLCCYCSEQDFKASDVGWWNFRLWE